MVNDSLGWTKLSGTYIALGGEQVFLAQNFQPNDPASGWDGSLDGKFLNPAVFVYFAEIEFVDGEKRVFKGDVALVR